MKYYKTTFNVSKPGKRNGTWNSTLCQHVTFTRKKTKRVDRSFRLHSTEIPKVDKTKYLGVTINSKVTWNNHIT